MEDAKYKKSQECKAKKNKTQKIFFIGWFCFFHTTALIYQKCVHQISSVHTVTLRFINPAQHAQTLRQLRRWCTTFWVRAEMRRKVLVISFH